MSEHRGATDSVHEVKLESRIVAARFKERGSSPGETVALEVLTQFVGDGSKVRLEIRTCGGKNVAKLKCKAGRNRVFQLFEIPESVDEDLYFEARLPDHGLSKRSKKLRIGPRRSITNARWDRDKVWHGETLKLSADTENVTDGTPVRLEIFERGHNDVNERVVTLTTRAEASKIEAEWLFQYPGRVAVIPSESESSRGYLQPAYFFVARIDRLRAESGLVEFFDTLTVEFIGFADGDRYVLRGPDGSEESNTVPGEPLEKREALPGKYEIGLETKDS